MNNLSGLERQVLCRKYIKKYNITYQEAATKVDVVVKFLSDLKKKLGQNKRLTPERMRIKFDEEKENIWRKLEV